MKPLLFSALLLYPMSLLNLTLSEARELADKSLEIIETAPPFAPRHYTPEWGHWRVIRERERADGIMEIVVARELLREIREPKPSEK